MVLVGIVWPNVRQIIYFTFVVALFY